MTSTPNNPNSQPVPNQRVEYGDGERALLDIHALDAWRTHQHGILTSLRDNDPDFMNGKYVKVFEDNVDDSLDKYLEQQGLDKNAPGYGRLREIYRNASIDKIHDDLWYTSPAARNGDPAKTASERDLATSVIRAELAEADSALEKDAAKERFERIREAKLKAYVELMKGPVFRSRAKREQLRAAYDTAQKDYLDLLNAEYDQQVNAWVAEGKDTSFIADELAKRVNADFETDVETQRQLLIKDNGKMGEWLDRYANMGRGKKIAIGVGLGAIAAGTGFGLGLLAGAVGAAGGAALIGGASAGGLRLFGAARTYNLRKSELFRTQTLPRFNTTLTGQEAPRGVYLKARDFMFEQSVKQVERGEKIKKRAVYWTLGSVALGAASGVAGTLYHGIQAGEGAGAHWEGGWIQHWIEQSQNHSAPTGGGSVDTGDPGPDTGGEAPNNPSDIAPWPPQPSETPPPPGGGAETRDEMIKDYIREHAAARKIDNGEGWHQTLEELGVKSGDWNEILQKAGPKLHEIRYGGVRAAYWDTEEHEWRINMTENRKMSPEALKILIEEADKEGALKHTLDTAAENDTSVPAADEEMPEVQVWNDATPEQILQKAYPGLTEKQAYVDINELYDKLGPDNVFEHATLSEQGDNIIRIDQAEATVKFTPQAEKLWDQMHPEEDAVARIIAEGRESSINIATHGERWTTVIDKLNQEGVTDVPKDKYGSILRQLWPQINALVYDDGTPVADLDRHGNLIMNESPTQILHPEALKRLVRLLYKNTHDLAA